VIGGIMPSAVKFAIDCNPSLIQGPVTGPPGFSSNSLVDAFDHDRTHHDPIAVIAGAHLVLRPRPFPFRDHLADNRPHRLRVLAAGAGLDFEDALHLLSPDYVHVRLREPDA